MPDEQLRRSLAELRAELARLESDEAHVRARLDALIAGIETRLETPENHVHHSSLVEDLRSSILQFEASHPRATAILNQVMAALGNVSS